MKNTTCDIKSEVELIKEFRSFSKDIKKKVSDYIVEHVKNKYPLAPTQKERDIEQWVCTLYTCGKYKGFQCNWDGFFKQLRIAA
jgi:hypothetical protein